MLSHARLEAHLVHRIGWLRAAVLGANDGIVSTASLIVGVAAAGAARERDPGGRDRPGWWPGRCRWRPESMSRSARSPTRSGPTWRASDASSPTDPAVERDELAAHLCRARARPGSGAAGRRAADGARRLGAMRATSSACPRSTRPRPVQAALASAATFAVGCGPAAWHSGAGAGDDRSLGDGGHAAGLGRPGRGRGAGGRRGRVARHGAGAGLGRDGHGRDGGGRASVRCGRRMIHRAAP